MKIINSGNTYHIYDSYIKTSDKFNVGTYKINFSPQSGFSVSKTYDLKPIDSKIYGSHYEKLAKIEKSYDMFDRSLGVLLSGGKGIGKSLFVQLLAEKYIQKGYPVFIIDRSYPGLINYLDSIEQEIVVIFDEFEKNFYVDRDDNDCDSQEDMLSLLDGTSHQKRLYIATINEIDHISTYLINRPGRFHYHIRFNYPTYDEVIAYLKDETKGVSFDEIKKAAIFSQQTRVNYDMLRAIAFELNLGETFENAVKDLNIIKDKANAYDVFIQAKDGRKYKFKVYLDLLSHYDQFEILLENFNFVSEESSSKTASGLIKLNLRNHYSIQYYNDYMLLKPELFILTENTNIEESDDSEVIMDDDIESIKLYPDHYTDYYKYF